MISSISSRSLRGMFFAFVSASSLVAQAQGTHLWTQSRMDDFEKGTPRAVSLSSDGHLRATEGVIDVATTPSTYVWSVAVDRVGTTYAATASPASVVRIAADGKATTLFESRELSVQTLRLGPDGALYVATLPAGKVYRIPAQTAAKLDDASATLIFDAARFDAERTDGKSTEAKAHYIWDLTFDAHGLLYIATGGPAAIYRVDPAHPAAAETFFHCDEQHIRALAWDAAGNLIAGTDGSGLVYRITPQGRGYVLFQAPRREITSLTISAKGTIYAAAVGDRAHNPLPQLPVQGPGQAVISFSAPGSMQSANASTVLPEGSEIYALVENQAPRKVWSGKDEIVYALAAQNEGVLALTGNRGRIFRIQDDGAFADVAHIDAQQALTMATAPNGIVIGAGNTGRVFRLAAAQKHEFASDVLDAGALARFGRVETQPGSKGFALWTRTGNVEQPARGGKNGERADWGWSDWQPLANDSVASPPGRYLQWKAVLEEKGSLGSVGVNYLPVNAAPVVDEVVVAPGTRFVPQSAAANAPTVNLIFPSQAAQNVTVDANMQPLPVNKDRTGVTVRWSAHDDNGDDLLFSLYLRGDGESVWRLVKDAIADRAYSFDAALVPDGGYQIKVVASDSPAHTPTDALTGTRESERFEIDSTPPVITALTAAERVKFDAEDSFSPLARAEYSLDAGPWQYVEPVGNLSDARREHYDFALPATLKPGEHLLAVRVYDRHDNMGSAKTVFTILAR